MLSQRRFSLPPSLSLQLVFKEKVNKLPVTMILISSTCTHNKSIKSILTIVSHLSHLSLYIWHQPRKYRSSKIFCGSRYTTFPLCTLVETYRLIISSANSLISLMLSPSYLFPPPSHPRTPPNTHSLRHTFYT